MYVIRVEKIIDYVICFYLVYVFKGRENGYGFINLNKLNKCFVFVILLFFSKIKNNYCRGSYIIKRFCK